MASSRYSTPLPPDDQLAGIKQHSRDAFRDGLSAIRGTGSLLRTKSGRDTVGTDLSKTSKHLTADLKHLYDGWRRKWDQSHPTSSSSAGAIRRPPVFKSEQQALEAQSLGRRRAAYGSNAPNGEYVRSLRY
ncbi:hypothetical protein Rt10032_c09g3907 [Rhodotorula toruloides]|uniref:Uncharacterized protein n=1 Tax=Rhodotorula toruloides TaxID=5286 RepID=A0A511KHP3_RHOTO|nr:hypothetical protein Rt10032_c09g3907 [Rhodotorula toruloides]